MEAPVNAETASAVAAVPEDPVLKVFKTERHQAYSPEDLVKVLDIKSSRDPEKLKAKAAEFKSNVAQLVEAGHLREIGSDLYKMRLFFDAEHMIEHAFIGGMGNEYYSFKGTLFRLNIGVLSVFVVRDPKKKDWTLTVRDATIGKDYCIPERLGDGVYVIGNEPRKPGEKNYLQVAGRYIEKKHVTLTINDENIKIEDHRTLNGTRIDHLTEEGLASYHALAQKYLKEMDPKELSNRVKRGRFVLNELVQNHRNFESTFFNAVVESIQP